MALSQIRFCKKFLGDSFFATRVDIDIHEERKNESTTKFAAKGRICDSAKIDKPKTIGIIGGGQLGRMICFAAHRLGFRTVIFTDQKNSPASFVTNQTIIADYQDQIALKKFASLIDIATFEFENIPLAAVEFLSTHVEVAPNPQVLKITQNRILEKNFLNAIGIKTVKYAEISSLEDLLKNFEKFKFKKSQTAILKTALMGYDGKGQIILKDEIAAKKAWSIFKNQKLILEKFCPFDSEISVIVARSKNGEISAFEPLTNIHKNGILDESHYPAKISKALQIKAQELAKKIAQRLDLIGVLAVEFFVVDDELLVNELAPRPHNSGHFSMDAAITSQFEQLVRAIADLPLGSTQFHSAGYMKNLIGDEVKDLEKFYKNPRAKIHLYGKEKIAKGRKMAHVNILN
ncbi:MAG: 5-(carboxyamino)imidazole ribonucleotide synthase [Rickettsiales bacterium]|nr:5-(carboxyamino)imidazole ribonucleotide synthase [Rickettsiales bacterium]